jgi:DNA-binding transcriptional LysR family regulator
VEIKQVKIFYTIARNPDLAMAAEVLRCSKEEMLDQVHILEKELGTRLFHRDEKKWGLNPQGHTLFKSARSMLIQIETAKSSLLEKKGQPVSGPLRISTTKALTSHWIPQFVVSFKKKYPDVILEVIPDDRPMDLLSGGFDVAIRPLMPTSPELIQHYLMTWHVGLYASPKYIRDFGLPTSVENLDTHRFLAKSFEGNEPYREAHWYLHVGKKGTQPPRTPVFKTSDLSALVQVALDGMGIIAVSEELNYVQEGRLVRVLSHIKGPTPDIYYICEDYLQDSPKILAFKEHLQEGIQNQMKLYIH